ncbi:MAG: class I SAM-dependent methyltransferase [Myxococcota bacterium]
MSDSARQHTLDTLERAAPLEVPTQTRLRLAKAVLRRAMRGFLGVQADINRAVVSALRSLDDDVRRLEIERVTRADLDGVKGELAATKAALTERIEWLTKWTESFRKELFFELRHRLEEHDRLTQPEILDRSAYHAKVKQMPSGLLVNLGSGDKGRENHLNVDQRAIDGIDIRADVRHLPFEKQQVAELYCAHLIEHFTDAELRSRILPYWLDLLRPGGKLVIVCPDAEAMMKGWVAGEFPYEGLREVTFGGQEYEGNTHYTMFTPSSLEQLLREVGFTEVHRRAVGRVNGKCLELELEAIR